MVKFQLTADAQLQSKLGEWENKKSKISERQILLEDLFLFVLKLMIALQEFSSKHLAVAPVQVEKIFTAGGHGTKSVEALYNFTVSSSLASRTELNFIFSSDSPVKISRS